MHFFSNCLKNNTFFSINYFFFIKIIPIFTS